MLFANTNKRFVFANKSLKWRSKHMQPKLKCVAEILAEAILWKRLSNAIIVVAEKKEKVLKWLTKEFDLSERLSAIHNMFLQELQNLSSDNWRNDSISRKSEQEIYGISRCELSESCWLIQSIVLSTISREILFYSLSGFSRKKKLAHGVHSHFPFSFLRLIGHSAKFLRCWVL